MKLQIVINETYEEENALVNIEDNTVLAKGDYYHDKISEYIEGFLSGLDFAKLDYELEEVDLYATPDMEIFNICGFYNGNDD